MLNSSSSKSGSNISVVDIYNDITAYISSSCGGDASKFADMIESVISSDFDFRYMIIDIMIPGLSDYINRYRRGNWDEFIEYYKNLVDLI